MLSPWNQTYQITKSATTPTGFPLLLSFQRADGSETSTRTLDPGGVGVTQEWIDGEAASTLKVLLHRDALSQDVQVGTPRDLSSKVADVAPTDDEKAVSAYLALQFQVKVGQGQIAAGIIAADNPDYVAALNAAKAAWKPAYLSLRF